jgi:hypothetical protein
MKDEHLLKGTLSSSFNLVLETITKYMKTQDSANLGLANALVSLKRSGISLISQYADYSYRILENWFESAISRRSVEQMLDESSTALLGIWIFLESNSRKEIKLLFANSMSHNLTKAKQLSIANDIGMLTASAMGLSKISNQADLMEKIENRFGELSKSASILDLLKIVDAWEFLDSSKAPISDMKYRFESVINEHSTLLEQTIGYLGLLKLQNLDRENLNEISVEHEFALLENLNLLLGPLQEESVDIVSMCMVSAPYLSQSFNRSHLFNAWSRFTSQEFKKAKIENYITRYLFALLIVYTLIRYFWPWFINLSQDVRIPIVLGFSTVILYSTVITLDFISEVAEWKLWKKGFVANAVALIGALVTLITSILAAR